MKFKPIRFIPDDTRFPIMRLSRFGFFVSGLLSLASVLLFVFVGLNVGVDFKGGTVMTIRTADAANIEQLREQVSSLGFGQAEIQEFGSPRDVLIRLPAVEGGDEAQQTTIAKVKEALGPGVEFRSVEVVGPKVSSELAEQSILAVVFAIGGILFYVWFRFEWQFGVGAIWSLVHDVTLTFGLFSLTGWEFDLNIIAALLTIIGYSLNDKVVIDDRIRENLRKYRQMDIKQIIDLSVNETLPRTVMTSVTLLAALIALLFLGPEVIFGFTAAMVLGIVVGTYSSIFVSSSLLITLGVKQRAAGSEDARAKGAERIG